MRADGADRGAARRSRRRGRAPAGGDAASWASSSRRSCSRTPTSTTSAPSRPIARATGAPVYCPTRELTILADTRTAFFPPAWGTVEPWEAEQPLDGGERLQLAGLDIDVVSTPGHSPGHVTYAIDGALFSGDVLFQGSIGRTDLPGADTPRSWPRSRRCSSASTTTRRSTPATWGSPRSGASARRTPSCRRSRAGERAEASRRRAARTTCCPSRPPRAARLEDAARRILEPRRLRAHRDADLRGHRALRPRRGRVDRHRPEGDVHLRGRRRALADAAPRGHRAGLPRLPRARHAQARPAGEALVPAAATSARRSRRPGASASSGRSAPRRSAPTIRPSTPSRSSLLHTLLGELDVRGLRLRLGSLGSLDARAEYRERLTAYLRAQRRAPERRRARPHRPQPAARLRRQGPRHPGGHARRAAAARLAQRRGPRALRRGLRAPARRGHRLGARRHARARPRLLHAHDLRVHLRRAGRAVGRRRRRALRRAHRAARRPADARHGLGRRASSGCCWPPASGPRPRR